MKLPLLFTVGEWLQENAVTIIIAVVGWFVSSIGAAAGVIWKISRLVAVSEATGNEVKGLAVRFERHENDLDEHVRDATVHTTFEQRQAIYARFDKIERDLTEGHNRIENKLDKLTDWMMKR